MPVHTLLIAWFIALAICGSTACVQFALGMGISSPDGLVTLVIAMGSQYMPPEANVAKAAAIFSGATDWLPSTLAGSGSKALPLPPCTTPRLAAPSMIEHRSSWVAIAMKAEFTELRVASSTDMTPLLPPSALPNL